MLNATLPLLAMFTWTWLHTVALVAVAISTIAMVHFGFRKDDESEERRYGALEIADFFSWLKLEHAPAFFKAYSVHDLSGMWVAGKRVLEILRDHEKRKAVLVRMTRFLIEEGMKDEAYSEQIVSLVTQLDAMNKAQKKAKREVEDALAAQKNAAVLEEAKRAEGKSAAA